MAGIPANLKPIAHFVKIANEHSNRDPAVYYWCLLTAVQQGMKLDKKSPECVKYLTDLLNTLEQVKKMLADNEAVTNELVAQAHIEDYALKLFLHADNQDRAGTFNKNVVKAFYTSGYLFDVLTTFGELDEQVAENRKYAKWKAAYIHNCLKSGEIPVPGPAASDEQPEQLDVPTDNTPPQSVTGPEPNDAAPRAYMGDPNDSLTSTAASGAQISAAQYAEAQKCCKYALSAIQYEDAPAAIDNLKKALGLLQGGVC